MPLNEVCGRVSRFRFIYDRMLPSERMEKSYHLRVDWDGNGKGREGTANEGRGCAGGRRVRAIKHQLVFSYAGRNSARWVFVLIVGFLFVSTRTDIAFLAVFEEHENPNAKAG